VGVAFSALAHRRGAAHGRPNPRRGARAHRSHGIGAL